MNDQSIYQSNCRNIYPREFVIGAFCKPKLDLVHGLCWRQFITIWIHQLVFDGRDSEKSRGKSITKKLFVFLQPYD